LLGLIRRLGYEVIKPNLNSALYGTVVPGSSYSPWNADAEFSQVYTSIAENTLVDKYRCWELWQLVDQTRDIPGDLLEVGVWRGGTGALIAKRAASSGIDGAVILCDTFAGVVKAGELDNIYSGGEHADKSLEVVSNLLAAMSLGNSLILCGIFPDDTGSMVADRCFRFVRVDVDVYQSAKDVGDWVWPRLSVGGVVVYDDYGIEATLGVTRFVDEQQRLSDRLTIYNLNGHAVVIKLR
jgi:O-methyltransferase